MYFNFHFQIPICESYSNDSSPPVELRKSWLKYFMNVSQTDIKSCIYKLPRNGLMKYEFNCNLIENDFHHEETEYHLCQEFVYSSELYHSTAVTEFDLVCERNHLKVKF